MKVRRFSSYGPVDPDIHFCISRERQITQICYQLVGEPKKSGHFFTVFAPRQSGKSTVLNRVVARLRATHGEQLHIGSSILHHMTRRVMPGSWA